VFKLESVFILFWEVLAFKFVCPREVVEGFFVRSIAYFEKKCQNLLILCILFSRLYLRPCVLCCLLFELVVFFSVINIHVKLITSMISCYYWY